MKPVANLHRTGACILLAAASMAACSGPDGDPTQPLASIANLEISGDPGALTFIGQEVRLELAATDSRGDPVSSTGARWASSRPTVATVSTTGTVTARGNGSAVILAELGGVATSVEVIVAQALTVVRIEGPDTVFNPGVRTRLRVVAFDAGGNAFTRAPLQWRSADPSIVSIDANGLALPLRGGTAEIVAGSDGVEAGHEMTVVPEIPLEVDAGIAETLQWTLEDVSGPSGVIGAQATVMIPTVGTWTGVYGRSGETSMMRPAMLTPLGSVAKTVISGLVLKLVDEGVLSLDDTMGELLPPFDNVPGEVTIAQILQNTSGVASYTSAPGFVDSLTADRNRVWTREEVIRKFVGPPEFAPGSAYRSSNTGYALAELIAEAATPEPLIDLYHEYLYEPLGLTDIAVLVAESPTSPRAVTWNGPAGGPFVNFTETYDGPSFHTALGYTGSTIMNSATLARWTAGLFGELLSPAVRAAMMTAVPDDEDVSVQVGAGLGVRKYDMLGRTQWGHSGSMFNGSAFMLFDEQSGIVVALVYNQPGISHGNSHFRLVELLLQQALEAMSGGS